MTALAAAAKPPKPPRRNTLLLVGTRTDQRLYLPYLAAAWRRRLDLPFSVVACLFWRDGRSAAIAAAAEDVAVAECQVG